MASAVAEAGHLDLVARHNGRSGFTKRRGPGRALPVSSDDSFADVGFATLRMLVITEPSVSASPESLRGKERDTLRLTWEERRWTRRRVTTTCGREVALALPTGSVLRPGAIVVVEGDWYLAIEGCPEPVLTVAPRDCAEAIRIAFEVGNRHFPLALDGERLLVPDDTAMAQLLSRLGVRWERRQVVFDPVGAGHRHAHGTSAADGHAHPDSHQ